MTAAPVTWLCRGRPTVPAARRDAGRPDPHVAWRLEIPRSTAHLLRRTRKTAAIAVVPVLVIFILSLRAERFRAHHVEDGDARHRRSGECDAARFRPALSHGDRKRCEIERVPRDAPPDPWRRIARCQNADPGRDFARSVSADQRLVLLRSHPPAQTFGAEQLQCAEAKAEPSKAPRKSIGSFTRSEKFLIVRHRVFLNSV